jgi:hypothetical protein
MPVPAGGDDGTLGLFALEELDAYVQASVPAATGALVLELITTAIRTEIGSARYDALEDLSPLKFIALDVARRMQRNADGRRSVARQLDDFSTTVTYATETLQTPALTEDDIERIWRALGLRTAGAFTIRPAGASDRSPYWAYR